MVVALSLFSAIGWGRTVPVAVPSDQGFCDTESSVTVPFTGWDEQTRFFRIAFEAGITNGNFCVQVALGRKTTDFNDLLPEETDLIIGYDCGEWFVRDERTGEEGNVRCSTSTLNFNFDLDRCFNRNWNAAKITTRGTSVPAAQIAAEFKNNPMRVIIR